jgi:uncharacterized protein with HEPN domain
MSFKYSASECLKDILDNISLIDSYIAGVSREGFAGDDKTRDAVERCLERICEAIMRLGRRTAELMPDQPSAAIRGMGNRLRHAYDRIDFGVIWDTVHEDLPGLKADAERALARLRADDARPEGNPQ